MLEELQILYSQVIYYLSLLTIREKISLTLAILGSLIIFITILVWIHEAKSD